MIHTDRTDLGKAPTMPTMPTYTPDELDQAYSAVLRNHPDMTGERLAKKARRVAAIMRHVNDGPTWTSRA